MNKHTLILICNFLFLSILALARFDKPSQQKNAAVNTVAPIVDVAKSDVVDSLKESLAAETDARMAVLKQLDERTAELRRERQTSESLQQEKSRLIGEQERLERLRDELETERTQLSGTVKLTQNERDRLRDEIVASQTREKLMGDQLASREKDLKDAQADILALREAKSAAESANAVLSEKLSAAQTELNALRETRGATDKDNAVLSEKLATAQVEAARLAGEIETLRAEKAEANRQAARLVENVGKLAQARETAPAVTPTEATRSAPSSSDGIFDNFRKNCASIRIVFRDDKTGDKGALCERVAILVKRGDGKILALLGSEKTPLTSDDLNSISAIYAEAVLPGGKTIPLQSTLFMKADPRIIAFPVEGIENDAGIVCFDTENDPSKLATALVIASDGDSYGEAPVRATPDSAASLDIQPTSANRLFTSFAPKASNFVFSTTGKFVGFATGSGKVTPLSEPVESATLDLGDKFDPAKAGETAITIAAPTQPEPTPVKQ